MAFIASTYFLKVGDKRLEIGAFSIETIAFGIFGFVKERYNATFAPLELVNVAGCMSTWNDQLEPHYPIRGLG